LRKYLKLSSWWLGLNYRIDETNRKQDWRAVMTKAIFREFPASTDLRGQSQRGEGAAHLSRKVANVTASLHCPVCGSIIYSRRHRLCGVCATPLPREFMFSAAEASRIETLLESDRRKHRQWIARKFAEAVAVSQG
jgi:predicted nucleic acid-binding Zn ribbon protein